jgi:hypothetical protein
VLNRSCSTMLFPGLELLLPSACVVVCRCLKQPTAPFVSPPDTAPGPPPLSSGHSRRHPYPVQLPCQLTVVRTLCAPPPFRIPEHPGLTQVRRLQGGLLRLFACSGGAASILVGWKVCVVEDTFSYGVTNAISKCVIHIPFLYVAPSTFASPAPKNIGPGHYSNINTIGW